MSRTAWRNSLLIALAFWFVLLALLPIVLFPRPADAGTVSTSVRTVAVGGTVRPDGHGGWRTEANSTHSTRGVLRPRCLADGRLRVDVRPRTRAAGWWSATVDGTLAVQDVAVGFSSVQGGRLLLVFTRHGERISCADITAPGSNVWLSGQQVLP